MAAFKSAVAECRSRGWAVEREENEIGASCIAAPILVGGLAQAAISIAAPAARLNESATLTFAAALTRETATLAKAIASRGVANISKAPRAA